MFNTSRLVVAVVALCVLSGCAGPKLTNYKVGVVGFQQCRPDLVLKEIGYNEIQGRNEANRCSRKGMPVIFAAELASRLQARLKKEVVIVPLDVPYNYNIRSQIDLARKEHVDYLVGGKLDRYVDPKAVARARQSGILPYTATMSPTPESEEDVKVMIAPDLKLARVLDGKILSEYRLTSGGERGGEVYTSEIADKIAESIEELD